MRVEMTGVRGIADGLGGRGVVPQRENYGQKCIRLFQQPAQWLSSTNIAMLELVWESLAVEQVAGIIEYISDYNFSTAERLRILQPRQQYL